MCKTSILKEVNNAKLVHKLHSNMNCHIMALVAYFNLELHQMDVKTTFLNGDIDETIYIWCSQKNFVLGDLNNMICRLNKSIYGLKQAFR